MKNFTDFSELDAVKNHPVSGQIDQLFKTVIKEEKVSKPLAAAAAPPELDDQELSLSDEGLDIGLGNDDLSIPEGDLDEGFELSLGDDDGLSLSDAPEDLPQSDDGGYGDLSLGGEEEVAVDEFSLVNIEAPEASLDDEPVEALPDMDELSLSDDAGLDFGSADELSLSDEGGDELSLSDDDGLGDMSLDDSDSDGLSLNGDISGGGDIGLSDDELAGGDDLGLSFGGDELSLSDEGDLSDDAKEKLKEIDAIMDLDASQVHLKPDLSSQDEDLDEPLVSPDLDLGSLDFSQEEEPEEVVAAPKEEKPKRKKKEVVETKSDHDYGEDLKEISGAYSGEMERMQATISNLRADREELLSKIQRMEDDKVLQNRQTLSMRAELDERKIELTIIRKKLNEEISELKDRIKFFDEKRLILEEKNRLLTQELDKSAQKNKIDVKKVQMRERELEQKLELLKSDAESQIRHRDLKILELKRKIDSMEFDMESISQQEKRSVESRFELEDKLDKAIKTLRGAITVLEDETDRSSALNALKKNIDM